MYHTVAAYLHLRVQKIWDVMDDKGNMYVSYSAYVGEFHHSSILGGVQGKSVVAGAGEMKNPAAS